MSESPQISLPTLRRDYTRGQLLESQVDPDPIVQFTRWLNEAIAEKIPQPNATTLATVGADGSPMVRVVLVKSVDVNGFVFATNYLSRKGRDIDQNPAGSILFFWEALERQVRVDGRIEKTSKTESEKLFHDRPREAQLSAWASHQSEFVASRAELEAAQKAIAEKFEGKDVPLPEFWGGYRLRPTAMEFWQGRAGRLHDRLLYTQQTDKRWRIQRVAP